MIRIYPSALTKLYMAENNIFIDANVFIALLNRQDGLHGKASVLWSELENNRYSLVTSNFVISEVITVLSMRAGKQVALLFADMVYHKTTILRVLRVNEETELSAISYLKLFKSKNVSFCDCATMAILKIYNIKNIATFDKDFHMKNARFKIMN